MNDLENESREARLITEKMMLTNHINFFNINTPSRDEKVKRIEEIDKELLGGS